MPFGTEALDRRPRRGTVLSPVVAVVPPRLRSLSERTSCGRVSWRGPAFCFPGRPRGAPTRARQLAECSRSGTNAACPPTCQSLVVWTGEECQFKLARRSEGAAIGRRRVVCLRRASSRVGAGGGPWWTPEAARGGWCRVRSCSASGKAADRRPHDRVDCCSVPTADAEKPHSRAEPHSSGWIRTIDLMIMSRAPPCEGGQGSGEILQGDRFAEAGGCRVDPPVVTLVGPARSRPGGARVHAAPRTRGSVHPASVHRLLVNLLAWSCAILSVSAPDSRIAAPASVITARAMAVRKPNSCQPNRPCP